MNYKTMIQNIKIRRKNDLLLADRIFINALNEYSELRELEKQLKELSFKKIKGDDVDEKIIESLCIEKENFLKKIGLTAETLNPPPRCNICGDSGYANGKICGCIINTVAATSEMKTSFDDFDFSVFEESDKATAKYAFDLMNVFCDKFPSIKKLNILLYGKPGTGKTFLASCVADNLIKKGFSVVFVSAFGFLNKTLAYHTAPIGEKLAHIAPFLDCDLLVIDDLGTENMLSNVTVEYLYNVLNERISAGRHTLITTNLDDKGLKERYTERISSRLLDKNLSYGFRVSANDLRRKK